MTTSCCTAFVNMLSKHFPDQYRENKSTLVTPMMASARKLKQEDPDCVTVFIGPCVAKKQEAMTDNSAVDYVLTFEEIYAMMLAKNVLPVNMKEEETVSASNYGRNFAASGGVAAAVSQVLKEQGLPLPKAVLANGGAECKQQLTLIKNGKFDADILEGMCCPGGCIGGPAVLAPPAAAKGRMIKENMANKDKTVTGAVQESGFADVDLEI